VLTSVAGGWLVGVFLGAQWSSPAFAVLLAVGLVGSWSLVLHGRDATAASWRHVLGVLAVFCGLAVERPDPSRCGLVGELEVTAHVERLRYRTDDAALRLRTADGTRIDARTALDAAPAVGSLVALRAELRPRTVLQNPSPHPSLLPERAHVCWANLRGGRLAVLRLAGWRARLHAIRQRVRAQFRDTLDPEASAVARALVLGDGGALPYERRKAVASVGLAHLFAVSGLHVALVSGTVVSLLGFVFRGAALSFDARRIAAGLGVPLALLHAAFAGGAPSAWRAATTAAITWGLIALGKRPASVPVAAAVVLLLSGREPAMAVRPAFLLSIVSTSAILSAPRARGRWRRLREAGIVSARTLVATAPMVWWWFGGVPLVGWVANLVALPFGSWVVIPLAHGLALSSWVPAVTEPLVVALEWSVYGLLGFCDRLSVLAVTQELPPLDVTQGLVVTVTCIALLRRGSWRGRLGVAFVGTVLWLAADAALVRREQPRGDLRVTFVDVGQGDATLIDLPDGRLALIDTGQGERHPAARELRRLLEARRRSHIDLLVLTHGHPDHMGGLDLLLDHFSVGELWLNGQRLVEERKRGLERSVNRALQLGTSVQFAPELCGNVREFGGAAIELRWPCPRYDPVLDLNDNSLVLLVRHGDVRFLFTGDIESTAEERLVASGLVEPVDVLKVAHHGSGTSSVSTFLRAVRPRWAVVSSGAGNRYGHPAGAVLRRLRRSGARVWRTDVEGGLVLWSDGVRLWTEP
jgi:competence protein ComEC